MKNNFLILFILFFSINLFALDNTSDDWKNRSNKFKLESLAKDIVQADLNRLKSLAMAAGLKEQGSAEEYRNALSQFYGLKILPSKNIKESEKITIEKAGELKMIRVKEEGEENLHIMGKAKLKIESKEKETSLSSVAVSVRTIEADEIFINTRSKEITGIGHILFKDDKLIYEGEQFYYNYDINRGVLFEGRTQLVKGGNSGLDNAFFKGEKVVQTGKDDVTLYNGMLTTCSEYNPHYHLQVSRLWLSEKGEWGIINGIVYMGPIPYFYFPIYYHPKELLINPAFGFRSREGWYFNTTYYILGKPGDASTTASTDPSANKTPLTGLTKSASELRALAKKEPVNLFTITKDQVYAKLSKLYETNHFYKKYPAFKFYPQLNSLSFALRVFGDAYTSLGFYTGCFFYMKADFVDAPFKITLLSDFGFSRKLWKDGDSGLYVPYNPADRILYRYANDIPEKNTYYYLLANPLLPRTSQFFNMMGSFFKEKIKYQFQIEYATEKSYFTDFYDRKTSFTYFDVLADALSYNVQKQGLSAFQLKKDVIANSDIGNLTDFLTISFNYQIPSLFGLSFLDNITIPFETRINFASTQFTGNTATVGQTVSDQYQEKFLLSSFVTSIDPVRISGTLFDYEIVMNKMPEEIKNYQNKLKNKDAIGKDDSLKELYTGIDEVKNVDATSDKRELDYKLLLPLISKKVPSFKNQPLKDNLNYNEVINWKDTYSNSVNPENEISKDQTNDADKYNNLTYIQSMKDSTYNDIKLFSFNLPYSVSEGYSNTFEFDARSDNDVYKNDTYDTVQLLFLGLLDYSAILKHFNIVSNFSFQLGDGSSGLSLFKIGNGQGILKTSPKFSLTFKKNYEDINIYRKFIERSTSDINSINLQVTSQELTNWDNTSLNIRYEDSLINDLSFGQYVIEGTNLTNSLAVDLFTYNHRKEYNYRVLEQINNSTQMPNPPDPVFYSNWIGYDKIISLQSRLNLNFNLFPKDYPHKLSMGLAPVIKYVVPNDTLSVLKDEFWNDNSNDINWNSTTLNEAKEYLYYRSENYGPNLYTKLRDSFYSTENFWDGPKYYRKMFDSIIYNVNYKYTFNNIEYVSLINDLSFRLDNMGAFANRDNVTEPFAIYPDESLKLNLFNSLISYKLDFNFSKEKQSSTLVWYNTLSAYAKKLDNHKVMTMTNTHSLSFRLPGDKFTFKLPKGDWLSFSTSLSFKWDRTIPSWANNGQYNFFYLNGQTINLNALMDIFQFSLNFKSFNFVNTGYGFELDSGRIAVGYNVTEIPVFLRYFKFSFFPSLSYDFIVYHQPYLEGNDEKTYNVNFFTGNKLKFSLSMLLEIGKGTDFETTLSFSVTSENNKMYLYYDNQYASADQRPNFFLDLFKSFNFGDISMRRASPFKLQEVKFSIEHKLCDWKLVFQYTGHHEDVIVNINNSTATRQERRWDNLFEFYVTWAVKSENQLMKMFNKTKVQDVYKKGEWQQPVLSLDPNESDQESSEK